MTQASMEKQLSSIRDQARIVQVFAESNQPLHLNMNNLWRETGKLHAMVNALKSEVAGNEQPKVG